MGRSSRRHTGAVAGELDSSQIGLGRAVAMGRPARIDTGPLKSANSPQNARYQDPKYWPGNFLAYARNKAERGLQTQCCRLEEVISGSWNGRLPTQCDLGGDGSGGKGHFGPCFHGLIALVIWPNLIACC